MKKEMRYEVVRMRITPKNIKNFRIIDDRTEHPDFIKDRDFLEQEMVKFAKGENDRLDYPNRYDLTVFTYNQLEPEWLIVDGSHRLEGLKRIFRRKELDGFDAILIPSNVLGARTAADRVELSRVLDHLLRRNDIPTWVKKYDFKFEQNLKMSELLLLKTDFPSQPKFVSWSNKNRIDTGNGDAPTMPIDEYQKSRELRDVQKKEKQEDKDSSKES